MNRLPAVYGFLALGAAACGQSMATTPPARQPEEPTLTVAAETLATTFTVPGVVQARQHAEISTRMMARVTAVLVEVGAKVREGEPLLRLGTEDVSANRLKAEAAWTAATAARDEAARQAARMDTLVVVDAVSPVQRDRAHVALSQAEAQLALAVAARREVETAAGYATIRAPFTGAVVARHVDAGDLASPGMALLEFESDGPRDVVLGVPADLAANLRTGAALAVTTPDGRRTAATIRAIRRRGSAPDGRGAGRRSGGLAQRYDRHGLRSRRDAPRHRGAVVEHRAPGAAHRRSPGNARRRRAALGATGALHRCPASRSAERPGAGGAGNSVKTGISGQIAQRFLNSKLTPLLIGASLAAGVGGLLTTPREEEPQIRVPMIDVAVGLPGAAPREVERRVVEPLERAIWEVSGVEYVYSAAQHDGALVTARFKVGTAPETALTRLYGKLLANAASTPAGATPPLVTLHGINEVPILTLTLSGGADAGDGYLLRQQAAELMAELKRIPDVAEIWVTGGAPREVAVTLDPAALAARGLSAAVVLQAVGAANAELPAGELVAGNRSVPVRVGSLLRNASDVGEVVVGVAGERAVRLRDVARVSDGPAEPSQYASFLAGGTSAFQPAVTIAIAKRAGTNAAHIADQVLQRVDQLRGRVLSDDVRLTVTRNYGATANDKARELLLHILIATLGVALLVWLTLGWREAVVVLVAVPVTLALTLLVYRLYGYTLNRITLFALVFAIGILVDDAIVVVENIARHLALGRRHPHEAAALAVDEVGNPTILATLTVIAAILPMAFVSGLMGPYMRPIPVGASVAMVFSLGVAFVVTPYLAVRLLRAHPVSGAPTGGDVEMPLPQGRVAQWYRGLLEGLIAHPRRRLTAYGVTAGLLLLAVLLVPLKLVTVKMLPFDNKSEFQLIVDMPQGTALERTGEVAQALALVVARDPAVSDVQTYVGVPAPFNFNGLVRHYFLRRGPTVADVQVNLKPRGERAEQSHAIALRVRPAVDSVARVYGAAVKLAEVPPGPPVQATLSAEIYGPTYEAQIAAARHVRRTFLATPGVVDVDWSVEAPHTEIHAAVSEAEARRAATSPAEVTQTIAATMGGAVAGLLHDDQAAEAVPIRVQLPDSGTTSAGDVAALPVATPTGPRQLGTLAAIDSVPADQPIFHKNLRPVVYVTGDVAGRLESPAYAMLAMAGGLERGPDGLPVYYASSPTLTEKPFLVWDGEWKITVDVFRDLGIAFAAVLVLIYVLVVAWFQSFTIPLVIMAPIPLTLIGILPAHAVTGAFFTATSMIGMIALAGIIVRNSILLVDFIELGRERGKPVAEAVIASGLIRARPIALTAAAVVIGGMVMVSDPIFQGLGIALISGAVIATALTLVAIPLLYYEMKR